MEPAFKLRPMLLYQERIGFGTWPMSSLRLGSIPRALPQDKAFIGVCELAADQIRTEI
jgi:hypothetical protein